VEQIMAELYSPIDRKIKLVSCILPEEISK
jgi:hypothetical protein